MTGSTKQSEIGSTLDGVHVYGTIGVLSEFKTDGKRTVYQERMEQYFLANMIPEERKVPFLITCLGEQTYIMLKGEEYARTIMQHFMQTVRIENFYLLTENVMNFKPYVKITKSQ
ncbi:uncharacterized protein LOC115033691 [Acyrthosiphon pisum]|uniref:Uncharacterized protein n=1 Tax=Acyrthosiphon pisum TaxID=7029 RepID=A0A8R2NLP3_ACYPI|nr:uncharacterized protein LOC115033691 [Acyrthosiphon pisum]